MKMCTFWYLETMHFHINSPKTVKMPMASPQGLQEVCHQATKPPAKQPAWWQVIKILRAREAIWHHRVVSPRSGGFPKITKIRHFWYQNT